jgi:hypothetical protein
MEEGFVMNRILYKRLFLKNQNFLAVVTGSTGSGKSYSCLQLVELWYKQVFDEKIPMDHVCFSLKHFIKTLIEKKKNGELKRGDLFIYEEAGTEMAAQDFQSEIAKVINYVLQSFRNLNIGVLFNLPYFDMLNKTTRKLIHMKIEAEKVKKTESKCYLKPFFLQYNESNGKIYRHYPAININGVKTKVQRVSYSLASKELRSIYEIEKEKFVDSKMEKALEVLERVDRKINLNGKKPLTDFQKEVISYVEKGIISPTKIAGMINVSQPKVTKNIGYMRRKGYDIPYPLGNTKNK